MEQVGETLGSCVLDSGSALRGTIPVLNGSFCNFRVFGVKYRDT